MKTVSIVRYHCKEIHRMIESDGKNSFTMYPQEIATIQLNGKNYDCKLSLIEYVSSENILFLVWTVINITEYCIS